MAAVQQLEPSPTPTRPRSIMGPNADVEMDLGGGGRSLSARSLPTMTTTSFGSGPQRGDTRIVVIVYGPGQDRIVSVFAEVLGKSHRMIDAFRDINEVDRDLVVGVQADKAKVDVAERGRELVVAINAHCVNLGMPPDVDLSAQCDYEFLYTETPFFRRDLCRFISFTLGQLNHHETLMAKPRTYFISTTFPDVRAALPNIDILTVGADAVEIRVDLLKEPLGDGTFSAVPSLSYVGEQVMLLRQRTELPIIFTTRCTRENGRFPMDNPDLYLAYLYRAIQWGVEYIDVELWLPEAIRKSLWERKGSSHIMSAFHDFSGTFKWPSRHAEEVFVESQRYADIIKMIAIINDPNENFELEYFRSKMRADYPDSPPFSAVNMGETGQFSRTLNKVFTPITHPLLPIIAAPGQMSASEINQALALLGQLPRKSFYGISSPASRNTTPQAPFYEKCFNELGLPHHFAVVQRLPKGNGCFEAWCNQKNFGGAYLNPPVSFQSLIGNSPFFASVNGGAGPILSEAARVIGVIDTIVVRPGASSPSSAPASIPSSPRNGHARIDSFGHVASGGGGGGGGGDAGLPPNTTLILDNATWRGILSALTRDLAPSAYFGRAAVVLASSSDDAASVIFALKALRVGKIYTVGFKTPPALAHGLKIEPFNSLESLQRARMVGATDDAASPFVVVSALGPDKNKIVAWVVRAFGGSSSARNGSPGAFSGSSSSGGGGGGGGGASSSTKKVFLDLADEGAGVGRKGDPSTVAEQSGFAAYGSADTAAFATVETLRLLVGQNVPYSFVRLASGRGIY
ncbi:aldolase [Cryphonectria parasitica EP155]|uniref:Aldolase n=1 Tax=Cryphonectria parasitica (strain ATCC 38755 / EP155) TaxID=660469 RepID=A0A9P5CK99_CRYP1|nr:aldolase [Cryphonectria parasitica EP155]KAF3760731.1 aldolase [Cryphonectria parasitica EP155]